MYIHKRAAHLFLILSALLAFQSLPAVASPIFTIYIPCEIDSSAYVLLPDNSRKDVGIVVSLPQASRWPSYTASQWGEEGTVCASAVNAIHLLCSVEEGKGRTISILPETTIAPAAGKQTFFSFKSDGGKGIFGGWAPTVGTPVYILRPEGSQERLSSDKLPGHGDTLVIPVEEKDLTFLIDIENRPGGRIIAWDTMGAHIIARVIRPVYGVGRFEGTFFQKGSRIRANHTGVIDVSTSPYGEIGGFQILPLFHADSKEMSSAWKLTQWMIIASENGDTLVGEGPLFSGGMVPGSQLSDVLWNMWSTYGRRPLIMCRINGGGWQFLPERTGRNDEALINITHIRLYYPFTKELNK